LKADFAIESWKQRNIVHQVGKRTEKRSSSNNMELSRNGCEATAGQANSGENVPSFDSLVPTRLTLGATFGSLSQPLPRARYSEFHINSAGISALGNGYPSAGGVVRLLMHFFD